MAEIDKKKLEKALKERYARQQRRRNVEKFEKELKETRNFINEVKERQTARLAEKAQKAQEVAVKSKERDLKKAKEQKNIFKNTPPSLVEVREKIKKQKLTSSLQKKTIIEDDQEKLKIITDSLESNKKDKNREKPEFFKPYFAKAKDSLGYLKQINNNLKELKSKFVDKQDTSIKEKEKTKEPKESFLGKFKDDMKNKVKELPKSIWDKIKSLIGGTFNAMLVGLLGRDMLRWLTGGFKLAFKATKGLGKLLIHFIKFIPAILRFFFVTPIGRALLAGGVTLFNFLKGYMNPDKKEVIDKSGSNRMLSGAHNTLKMFAKGTDWALNKVGVNSTFTQDLDEARKNQNSVDIDKKIQKFFEQTQNGRATDLENRLKTLNGYKNAKKDWAWYADFFNHILGIPVNDGINLKNKFLGLFREYLRASYWKKDSGESYGKSVYDFDNHRINEEALKTAYLNFITQKSDLTRMFTFLGDSERGEILRKLLYDDRFLSIQAGKALTTAEQRRKYNADVNKQISNIITKVNNDRIDPVDDGPLKTSASNTTNAEKTSGASINVSNTETTNVLKEGEPTTNENKFETPTGAALNTSSASIKDVLSIPSNVNFNGLLPELKDKFLAMAQEYKSVTGQKILINSGKRTMAQQAALRAKYGAGAAKPDPNAPHIAGYALDASSAQMNNADKLGLLRKHGLHRPLLNWATKKEPWHVEPIGFRKSGSLALNYAKIKLAPDYVSSNSADTQQNFQIPSSNTTDIVNSTDNSMGYQVMVQNKMPSIVTQPHNNQQLEAPQQQSQNVTNIINLGEQQDRSDYGTSLFPYFSTLDIGNV